MSTLEEIRIIPTPDGLDVYGYTPENVQIPIGKFLDWQTLELLVEFLIEQWEKKGKIPDAFKRAFEGE